MNDQVNLQRTLEDAMTVEEMIGFLKQCDLKAKVAFKYGSGDYWRTEIAGVVTEIEEGQVRYSDYHQTLATYDEDEARENGLECQNDDLADIVLIG